METNPSPVDAYHIPGAGIFALDCPVKWCVKTNGRDACDYFDGVADDTMGDRGPIRVMCKQGPYGTGAMPTCTCGDYATEADSAQAFDAAVEKSGLFSLHREATGKFLHIHPEKKVKEARIDRLLLPTEKLKAEGWQYGAVGVELKRSGERLGPPLSQLLDYMGCVWRTREGLWVVLNYGFVFPLGKCGHGLGSVLAQNRIGGAWLRNSPASEWYNLAFYCGEQSRFVLYPNTGTVEIKNQSFGKKTGSR